MKSVHIREVEDDVLEALKQRARRHGRSLQKEIQSLMVDAARMSPPESDETEDPLNSLKMVSTGRRAMTWSRDSYYGDGGR